jgi:hypothetical protein
MITRSVASVVAVLVVASTPATLLSQSGSSTIGGLVQDTSGAAVPGASLKIVNEATGVTAETVSNDQGLYRVVALVPGLYRVEAFLDGFEPTIRPAIRLEVGQTIAVDITLGIGRQAETIQVTATLQLVESQSSNVKQTVTREMLDRGLRPSTSRSRRASRSPEM